MRENAQTPHAAGQLVKAALLETMVHRAQASIAAAGDINAVQTARYRLVDDLNWLSKVGASK